MNHTKLKPIKIYLLVLPRVHLLDLAAPAQIFTHQALEGLVELHFISTHTDVRSHQGLHLAHMEPLPDSIEPDSWLMLIGTSNLCRYLHEEDYRSSVAWLAGLNGRFGLMAGICSGTILAAQAGLLSGKQCTTHHELISALRNIAPEAQVKEDCIFVRDGNLWSSAGISTGLDLCLQLVADHWGQDKALAISRGLVLYHRRSGSDHQLSFWLEHRNHMQSRIHAVQDLIMAEPGRAWTLAELADRVHLSERHLRRVFNQATGNNLQDYLQRARVELARQLLEQTRLSLQEIAERCGFQAERSLRRTWSRWMQGTPSSYRRIH